MKTTGVIFIPGFSDNPEHSYPNLFGGLEASGCEVYPVTADWLATSDATLGDMVDHARETIDRYHVEESRTVLLGHSFGALVAAHLYAGSTADMLILCSPSPTGHVFNFISDELMVETQNTLDKEALVWDGLRTTDIADVLSPVHSRPSKVLCGSEERGFMQYQVDRAACALGVTASRVLGAPHSLDSSPAYVQAVISAVIDPHF